MTDDNKKKARFIADALSDGAKRDGYGTSTDDKLLEEIARWICRDDNYGRDCWLVESRDNQNIYLERAKAKVQEHYVRLADDQTFPILRHNHAILQGVYEKVVKDAGFRKIEGGRE